MQRIAPNNQLPATNFVEVYKHTDYGYEQCTCNTIDVMGFSLDFTYMCGHKTIAIFKIRENKLPTKHKF